MKNLPNPALTLVACGALSVVVAAFMDRPFMAAVGWLVLLTGELGVVILQAAREVSSAIRESQVRMHLSDFHISNVERGPAIRIHKGEEDNQ